MKSPIPSANITSLVNAQQVEGCLSTRNRKKEKTIDLGNSGNLGASILGISQDHTKPTSMINNRGAMAEILRDVALGAWGILSTFKWWILRFGAWGSFPKNEQNRLGGVGDLLVIHH